MPVETWKSIFDWATVVLIAFTVVSGAGALITGDIINRRQESQSRQFEQDLTAAKTELGQQQERTALAGAQLAGLERDAAEAKTRETIAERKLLELQIRVRPRHLTDKDAAAFVAALRTLPNGIVDFGYTSAGGDEAFNFAKQFLPLFKQVNWKVRNEASISNHLDVQVIGVGIFTSVPAGPNPSIPPSGYIKLTPAMEALQKAFRAVGIEPQFTSWFPGKTASEVIIGSKPEPTP